VLKDDSSKLVDQLDRTRVSPLEIAHERIKRLIFPWTFSGVRVEEVLELDPERSRNAFESFERGHRSAALKARDRDRHDVDLLGKAFLYELRRRSVRCDPAPDSVPSLTGPGIPEPLPVNDERAEL
jgi:hypothetical protein